ncbi:phosphate uptake regulator PhoU [Candidatus Bipolaricaulota bacterium]|nr:phosphate uptake regulator PhoU [Candidatus Bipolaricaulota bacterium]HHR85185.1 phosphate uptake regulator PhoU [Candidatus Acetothermia bacterium]
MDKRSVQITGGGTYFVTLPKAWATKIGISRGSEVTVVENATGSLLLMPKDLRTENSARLSLEGKDAVWIQRAIISCYVTGYDVIETNGTRISAEQRRAVRQVAQSLVGLEIMDESQDSIVLHCLVSMRDFAAEATLRRIFTITKAMLADSVSAFLARDTTLANDVVERDIEADRLTRVMSRELGLLLRDLLLEKEIGMSRILFHEYHGVAKILERIGDHAVQISRAVSGLTEPIDPDTASRIERLQQDAAGVVLQSVEAFLKADLGGANGALSERAHTTMWEEEAQLQNAGVNALSLAVIFGSLLRVRDYAFNIAEAALNMGVPHLQEKNQPN